MKGSYLGEFEEIVLLIVGVFNGDAYGVNVKKRIIEQLNRKVTLSSVHTALHRLEKKGFVASKLSESSNERGGKRKRLFEITVEGSSALEIARDTREQLWTEMKTITINPSNNG